MVCMVLMYCYVCRTIIPVGTTVYCAEDHMMCSETCRHMYLHDESASVLMRYLLSMLSLL